MTITKAAEISGLTADTLRYYEKIGLISDVERRSGIRSYNDENLKRIHFIKCMRAAGMPLETLVTYIHLFEEGEHTVRDRKNLLIEQKERLDQKIEALMEVRQTLEDKIKNYDSHIVLREQELLAGPISKDGP